MKKIKDVIGSKEASKELIIGKDTVYIHTNIRPYVDKNEIDKENKSELYIYDEIQFTWIFRVKTTRNWSYDKGSKLYWGFVTRNNT